VGRVWRSIEISSPPVPLPSFEGRGNVVLRAAAFNGAEHPPLSSDEERGPGGEEERERGRGVR